MLSKILECEIMLGSKSPRRSFLLEQADISYVVQHKDVDESYPNTLDVANIAAYIVEKKYESYLALLEPGQIGLVADTIVVYQGEVLEKPKSKEEAFEMLSKLSDSKHTVYTAVCLFDTHKKSIFTGETFVYFNAMSNKEIEYYIEKYQPFDKAGAYGVQEWLGYTQIEKIEGSYSNIMGLPMEMVYSELLKW